MTDQPERPQRRSTFKGIVAIVALVAALLGVIPSANASLRNTQVASPDGDRALFVGDATESWNVRHAPALDRVEQTWEIQSPASFNEENQVACDEEEFVRIGRFTSSCADDLPLMQRAANVGAVDVISLVNDGNQRRWLSAATAGADLDFVARTTTVPNPRGSLWLVIPVEGTSQVQLMQAGTGRYLARHGGPGNVKTIFTPNSSTYWELDALQNSGPVPRRGSWITFR